jgi:hypothetical protein
MVYGFSLLTIQCSPVSFEKARWLAAGHVDKKNTESEEALQCPQESHKGNPTHLLSYIGKKCGHYNAAAFAPKLSGDNISFASRMACASPALAP